MLLPNRITGFFGMPRLSAPSMKASTQEGSSYTQRTIVNGRRQSAAKAFLTPVRSRPNLDVRTGAHATGLVFDGNIESLPGEYIYLPEFNRSVTVDARAILEALDVVYDMDRLVLELTTGELIETEAAADAAGR